MKDTVFDDFPQQYTLTWWECLKESMTLSCGTVGLSSIGRHFQRAFIVCANEKSLYESDS